MLENLKTCRLCLGGRFFSNDPVIDTYLFGRMNGLTLDLSLIPFGKKGIDKGQNVLMKAIVFGHENVAKLLAKLPNMDVNVKSDTGMTALMWAARKGQIGVIKILLQNPLIQVNEKDYVFKRTARDWARTKWKIVEPEVIMLLNELRNDSYAGKQSKK